MKKLWKVTVNQWGWDRPKTLYAESREDAEKTAEKYPASDPVEYAGVFNDLKADFLLGHIDQFEYEERGGKF